MIILKFDKLKRFHHTSSLIPAVYSIYIGTVMTLLCYFHHSLLAIAAVFYWLMATSTKIFKQKILIACGNQTYAVAGQLAS